MYRWKDYWNGTEIQETDPKTYGNCTHNIGGISNHWGQRITF